MSTHSAYRFNDPTHVSGHENAVQFRSSMLWQHRMIGFHCSSFYSLGKAGEIIQREPSQLLPTVCQSGHQTNNARSKAIWRASSSEDVTQLLSSFRFPISIRGCALFSIPLWFHPTSSSSMVELGVAISCRFTIIYMIQQRFGLEPCHSSGWSSYSLNHEVFQFQPFCL